MNIVYAGTPEFAVPALRALIEAEDHQVLAVYTQPDRPAGRGRKLRASPIKQLAEEMGIPVYQPRSLRDPEAIAKLVALNADLMVVAAYGLILPPAVLEAPRLGCLNIHASLLPRWRGAAPIHRAILAGDEQTGVTIMQMAEGLDTGDMLLKRVVPILPETSTAELHDELATLGAEALLQTLQLLEQGKLDPEVQDDSLATYANKLEKIEGEIDWSRPATEIHRQIRALTPWPIAQTQGRTGVLRIYEAEVEPVAQTHAQSGQVVDENRQRGIAVQTGEGLLWIKKLQVSGGKPLEAAQFLNGKSLKDASFGGESE